MSGIKATLFGRFKVERDNRQQIEGMEARKVQELLSYLLVHWERPQPRETLAELLWENLPPEKSKKNLRQTLWKLKSALDDRHLLGFPNVLVEMDWIQLNPDGDWWLDTAEFERIYARFKNNRARDLDEDSFLYLQQAVDLYQGDLLEGWYQEWCISERERFQAMYLLLLNKLVQYCEIHQKCEIGLAFGEKLLRHDRAYERAHRQMMRLYFLAGDRTGALRQYQRCAAALKEELDVEPSERTVLLYEQIKTEHFHRSKYPTGKDGRKISGPAVEEPASRLDEFADTLLNIPSQLQAETNLIKKGLQPGQ
jgi:DNA-binding SARP family transcriptional activator